MSAHTLANAQTQASAAHGRLYLVPAPLDFGTSDPTPLDQVLPDATLQTAARLTHWICENAKSARAYLKRVNEHHALAAPLQAQAMQELPRAVHKKGDHRPDALLGFDARALLAPVLQGTDMGLLSEAGMPAVADPGSSVVRAAHALGLEVVPLVGPVSLLLALAASGLNGQNFAFVGYLPQDAEARTQRIRELEALAHQTGQTQLFIETPYRNTALLEALLATLRKDTRLALACGLTLPRARLRSASVQQWKQGRGTDAGLALDLPTVFGIGL
ncbi:uroporphyrin-III methyltransferase [Hylemonella gracilis str. Niagara R]|uniref:Uroporphyrin-III methyltransferase n=1 Tax=Hylemonella gracilis str. Niagara R TaxID=1458275 RepID=A0A016XG13_9BURK|nr:SAM-dependent methyltransferase [Hylemonella gracilis]EYC50786.1 uroporphyrin-III methyltransferase [Hylemonella gracilis str. Niagara R]